MNDGWLEVTTKQNLYQYSVPVVIRSWPAGKITVKIGFVREHPDRKDLVLEKYWKNGSGIQHQQFNVRDVADWKSINTTVNSLWPELESVISADDIRHAIQKVSEESEILNIISEYPEILKSVPQDINLLTLPSEQKEALTSLLKAGRDITSQAIMRLSQENITDIAQLIKILENYKLTTINSLVTHVTTRLSFIDTFEKVIHDDDSYERRGPESVHNLLKANIWIVDRNYSILNDDVTLKNIIYQNWREVMTEDDSVDTRPDFLCMTNYGDEIGKIILIEIKRPSVRLKFSMLEQVMRYRNILQKYSGITSFSFEAYLVGRELEQLLIPNPFKNSGITVKTYTDFIGEARRFYRDYKSIMEQEKYAI